MKQALTAGILWVLLLFGGAWILAPRPGAAEPEKTDTPIRQTEQADSMDSRSVLQVYDGEKIVSMTMAEYLPGVVRGEMPAAFSQQALDAQAVAERTFICYHMAGGRKDAHPEADVCTSSACCSAYVSQEDAAARWGDKAEERANLWLGYIAAVLLHGFYDSCAMINTVASSLIFIAFVVIMYIVVIKKVNKESQNDGPIT